MTVPVFVKLAVGIKYDKVKDLDGSFRVELCQSRNDFWIRCLRQSQLKFSGRSTVWHPKPEL